MGSRYAPSGLAQGGPGHHRVPFARRQGGNRSQPGENPPPVQLARPVLEGRSPLNPTDGDLWTPHLASAAVWPASGAAASSAGCSTQPSILSSILSNEAWRRRIQPADQTCGIATPDLVGAGLYVPDFFDQQVSGRSNPPKSRRPTHIPRKMEVVVVTPESRAETEAVDLDARAACLHDKSIIVDMAWATNPSRPTPIIDGRNALARAIAAGVTAANVTVADYHDDFRKALIETNKIDLLRRAQPDQVLLVEKVDDIASAKKERKLGIITQFQTATPLEGDWQNNLRVLYRLGLRVLQLTYNERNIFGDGCFEPHDQGLTAWGVQVVRALNSFGVIIDVSHAGSRTAMDILHTSSRPVICSHANAAALTPHRRNLSDELIRAIRDTGGLVGATAIGSFCATRPGQSVRLSDYLDHIDYLVGIAGPDHVGIGSDIGEDTTLLPIPTDYEIQYGRSTVDAEGTRPNSFVIDEFDRLDKIGSVTRGLFERGYSEEVVSKILGGNFVRVAGQAWS